MQSGGAYRKAAMKAPNPTRLPAATLTLEAAPVESGPSAPVPVASVPVASASVPVASESEEPLPVASAPEAVVETRATVVLLLALTTIVRVELTMEPVPVPARVKVVIPVPTAGMSAGTGWVVMTAGCEVTALGMEAMEVSGAGMPVTTPRELVWVR